MKEHLLQKIIDFFAPRIIDKSSQKTQKIFQDLRNAIQQIDIDTN